MRLLGVLVLAAIMYFAVPLLWERAMVHKVTELANEPSPIPIGNAIGPIDAGNMAAAINPPVEIDTGINTGGWALYLRDPDQITVELFQRPAT